MRIKLRREVRKPVVVAKPVPAKRPESRPVRAAATAGIAPRALARFASSPAAPSTFQASAPAVRALVEKAVETRPTLIDELRALLILLFGEAKRHNPAGGDKRAHVLGPETL